MRKNDVKVKSELSVESEIAPRLRGMKVNVLSANLTKKALDRILALFLC